MAGTGMGRPRAYTAGELIVRQGDDGREAFLLTAGEAELLHGKADGQQSTTRLLINGNAFGEMGLIPGRAYSCTVRAKTAVEVLAIDAATLDAAFGPDSQAVRDFLLGVLENLRVSRQALPSPPGPSVHSVRDATAPDMPERSVRLLARTALSREILGGEESVLIATFPYCVGRATGNPAEDTSNENDLLVKDRRPYSVSRRHFSLEWEGGTCYFRDVGSRLGSVVNGLQVGGGASALLKVPLRPGRNSVHLGIRRGRLSFTFVVEGALGGPRDNIWRRLWRRLSG